MGFTGGSPGTRIYLGYTFLIRVHICIQMRPQIKGLSHGLRKCPPDTFLPSLRSGRPFESTLDINKKPDTRMGIWFFGTAKGTCCIMVWIPSSRNPANVHRTFAFRYSSPLPT